VCRPRTSRPGRRSCASEPSPYVIDFTPAARRGLARLPLPAATALHEHLTGPVADNPYRLDKPPEAPFDDVWTTRRGDYRALCSIAEGFGTDAGRYDRARPTRRVYD
jgi:mRNA interferase RelE/StbE